MILLCPLIHPPNRCRSQWLYTNAFFPSILWINVRLVSSGNERHSKGEMRVWALLCLSLEELCLRACVCACAYYAVCFVVWVGGMGVVWSVCLFVFVSGSRLLQSAPFSCDGLFVRHRHKIIRLVVVCLWSVLSCPSWFVNQRGISPVWLLSEDLSSLVFCNRSNKAYYVDHVWFHSITLSKCLFPLMCPW